MKEWITQINETIAQYNAIFLNDVPAYTSNDNGLPNRKISCNIDKDLFLCHGIDKIQYCTSCFMMQERLLEELNWKFNKEPEGYYIFPSAGQDFKSSIEIFSKTYPECEVKNRHLKHTYPAPVYRTCDNTLPKTSRPSCGLIVDAIFNINRHGRDKEQLNNLNALFCCQNITVFYSLLSSARDCIKGLSPSDKKNLFDELFHLCERILSIRDYVDHNCMHQTASSPSNQAKAFLNELNYSSSLTISLMKNSDAFSIRPPLSQRSNDKIKETLPTNKKWNYNRPLGKNRESCKDIFRAIVTDYFSTLDLPKGMNFFPENVAPEHLMESDFTIVKKYIRE